MSRLILTTLLALLCTANLQGAAGESPKLAEIFHQTLSPYQGSERDYLYYVLLAELPLTKQSEDLLSHIQPDDAQSRLLLDYLLSRKTLIPTDTFLDNASRMKDWKWLWQLHAATGYPLGITPPITGMIRQLAFNNRKAFQVYLSMYRQADGAIKAGIQEGMKSIRKHHPEWFDTITAKELGMPDNDHTGNGISE